MIVEVVSSWVDMKLQACSSQHRDFLTPQRGKGTTTITFTKEGEREGGGQIGGKSTCQRTGELLRQSGPTGMLRGGDTDNGATKCHSVGQGTMAIEETGGSS